MKRYPKRNSQIISWFKENAIAEKSELHFSSPFELIVAVILSAQCTDKRVNLVTPSLLKAYPTAQAMSKATNEGILKHIKSVSYPNSKADHLLKMSRMLLSDFGGEVPDNIEDLMKLPGVGRKTANVVASICFNEPVIAVDTHVFRVAHRLGLSKGKTPYEVEQDLENQIAVEDRARAHHWLILHGRYVCKAQKPDCGSCGVSHLCPKLMEGSKLSSR
ncbi:MAG: endonuclease III [Bacteroidales bacterium]|nr:endonuclease III [Bacteroidales bacterium]MBP5517588.1 endonuclease III [Bacteroidales bacterium]